MPQASALEHLAPHRVRATQHPPGRLQISIANGLTNPRAADPIALGHHRRHGDKLIPMPMRLGPQQSDIAQTTATKAPVLAHRDRAHLGPTHAPKKIRRLHRRHLGVEIQRHKKFHSKRTREIHLLPESCQHHRRRFARRDHPNRMRMKSQQARHAALASRRLHRRTNHRPMPQMYPIKNPQRQMQRLIQPRKLLQVTQHQHDLEINCIHRFHKPASGTAPRHPITSPAARSWVDTTGRKAQTRER